MSTGGKPTEGVSMIADGAIAAYAAVYATAAALAHQSTSPLTSDGEHFIGINDHTARDDGEMANVQVTGVGKGLAGATLTVGTHALLMVGADGKLYPFTSAVANKLMGLWLPVEGATSADAGDAIDVLILGDIDVGAGPLAAVLVSIADAGGFYAALNVEAALQELAATTGAAIIGVEDAAANFDGADVEAVLAEIVANLASIANAKGAALVGVEDVAANFTAATVEAVLAEIVANLASIANAKGASLVGVEDVAANFTAATVEAVLAEIVANLASIANAKGAALVGVEPVPWTTFVGTTVQAILASADAKVKALEDAPSGGLSVQTVSKAATEIAAEATLNFDLAIDANDILIIGAKMTKTAGAAGNASASVWDSDGYNTGEATLWPLSDISSPLQGPEQVVHAVTFKRPIPYRDDDGTNELHVSMTNEDGASTGTFKLDIQYIALDAWPV